MCLAFGPWNEQTHAVGRLGLGGLAVWLQDEDIVSCQVGWDRVFGVHVQVLQLLVNS